MSCPREGSMNLNTSATRNPTRPTPRHRGFADESCFHGLPQLLKHRGGAVHKPLWIVIIALGIIGFLAQLIDLFQEYAADRTGTVYRENVASSSQLPDFALCGLSSFSRQTMAKHDLNPESFSMILTMTGLSLAITNTTSPMSKNEMTTDKWTEAVFRELKNYEDIKKALNGTVIDVIKHFATNCSQTVEHCSRENGTYDCCESAEIYVHASSACVKIKGQIQSQDGKRGAQSVSVSLDRNDIVYSPVGSLSRSVGVIVLARETDIFPTNIGARTDIVLKRVKSNSLNRKESPCKESVQGESTAECILGCIFRSALGNGSNCSYHAGRMGQTGKVCGLSDALVAKAYGDKVFNLPETEFYSFAKQRMKDCGKKCIMECKRSFLSVTISSARLLPDVNSKNYTKDRALIDIYYESLREQSVTQYWKTSPLDLVGVSGGLLSLWTGGSVVALCHLVTYGCLYQIKKKQESLSYDG